MANVSGAYGWIQVRACSEEAIKELKKVLKWHDDGSDYATTYGEDIDGLEVIAHDSDYEIYVDFDGFGRWSYYANIEKFLMWPYNDRENNDIDFDLLENTEFYLNFSYVDEEPGFSFLYEAEVTLHHPRKTKINETEIYSNSWTDYDYTWANRIYFEYETIDSLICCYLEGQEDIEIYETLEKERDSLEKSFNQPLKEIIGNEYYNAYLRGKTKYEMD